MSKATEERASDADILKELRSIKKANDTISAEQTRLFAEQDRLSSEHIGNCLRIEQLKNCLFDSVRDG